MSALDNPALTAPATAKSEVVADASRRQVDRSNDERNSSQEQQETKLPSETRDTPRLDSDATQIIGNNDQGTVQDPSTVSYVDKYSTGWRRVIRNFSPSWFAVTMGTGITSILFYFIPFQTPGSQEPHSFLWYLSIIFFILNAVLFLAAFIASIVRYTVYPEIIPVLLADPTNSLFIACAPMGFATLIEMWTFVCVPFWGGDGGWAAYVAWGAWMGDAIVAVATTVFLCWTVISREGDEASLKGFTAVQLLPIAATLVAAGTGAEVAEVLGDPQRSLGTLVACYVMWGIGMPMACTVLVMYYQRLAVHKLPPREILVSSFLPLGPLGFGGYGIMYMGKIARTIIPATATFSSPTPITLNPLPSDYTLSTPILAGEILYITGWLTALVLWGWGLIWFVFAVATLTKNRPFPFNMGWWSFTFPLGVYASSTIQLGIEMPSLFLKGLGTAFAVAVILLWIVVFLGTCKGAISGKLFNAPCLSNLKREHREKGFVYVADKGA